MPHDTIPQRISPDEVKTPRIVRLLGGDPRLASNDEGDLTDADLAEIDAEFSKADALKKNGALRKSDEEWYARQELDCSFLRGPWPK